MAMEKTSSGSKEPRRNLLVEQSVNRTLGRIDDFISGEEINLPTPAHQRACEDLLTKSASVRTAALFLSLLLAGRTDLGHEQRSDRGQGAVW